MACSNSCFAPFLCLPAIVFFGLFVNTATAHAEGNRYKYPRAYKADISPVVAHRAISENKRRRSCANGRQHSLSAGDGQKQRRPKL